MERKWKIGFSVPNRILKKNSFVNQMSSTKNIKKFYPNLYLGKEWGKLFFLM